MTLNIQLYLLSKKKGDENESMQWIAPKIITIQVFDKLVSGSKTT